MPSFLPKGAGALRHRVTIQERIECDNDGASEAFYRDVMEVWAAIEPLSGRESFLAQQAQSQVSHRIRIRYLKWLTAKHRFLLGDRKFNIDGLRNADERKVYIECDCTEWVESPAGASTA